MTLKFCQRCKTLMSPHKTSEKIIFKCSNCNFSEDMKDGSLKVREKLNKKEEKGKGVGSDENIFATYTHKCEKCGYNKVQILDAGTYYSDEDNLVLLMCGKCGWSERVGRRAI